MTMPQLPPAYVTPPPALKPVRRLRNGVVDAVLGVVSWLVFIVVSGGSVFFSFFFAMATDSCYGGRECDEDLVASGMFTVWAGVGAGFVIAIVGAIVCVATKRYSFYWPLIGLMFAVGGLFAGVQMADAGVPG